MVMDVAASDTTVAPKKTPLTEMDDAFSRLAPVMRRVSFPLLCPAWYGLVEVGKEIVGADITVVVVVDTVVVEVVEGTVVVVGAIVVELRSLAPVHASSSSAATGVDELGAATITTSFCSVMV
jgi:hypothetical protein